MRYTYYVSHYYCAKATIHRTQAIRNRNALSNVHITQFSYEEQYIDVPGNEAWYDRYKYDIPVMHLDGDLLMMHRVDENKLRTALDKLKTRT